MQYIRGLQEYHNDKRTAVTLGKFDGLHLGHEKLVEKVISCGREEGLKTLVCAFDMLAFGREEGKESSAKRSILMTKQERADRLEGRIDYLVDCPFTREFSKLPAEDFIRDILVGLFHVAYLVVGTDCSFGYQKRGDISMLEKYQEIYGYKLVVVEKERYQDREISSTYVKEALSQGNMPLANRLLGYNYRIIGQVEHGKQLGRTLGFPTMNVAPDPYKLMPPNGVYVVRVKVEGKSYPGICNVGVKPTVTDKERMLVESFLFDYQGDAYGKEVEISLLEYRRPEMKFQGIESLKDCIDKDIAYGRAYFEKQ